jgi:hypothetical protein
LELDFGPVPILGPILEPISEPDLGPTAPVLAPILAPILEPISELDSGLTSEPELDSGLYIRPISGRKRKREDLTEVAEQSKFKHQLWEAEAKELYYNPWI